MRTITKSLTETRGARAALVVLIVVAGTGCVGDNIVSPNLSRIFVVTTQTTGSSIDPDGYELSLDGAGLDIQQPIATNDAQTFMAPLSGVVTVTLGDIADNCVVDENPRMVSTAVASSSHANFAISCS